MLLPDHRDHPK